MHFVKERVFHLQFWNCMRNFNHCLACVRKGYSAFQPMFIFSCKYKSQI